MRISSQSCQMTQCCFSSMPSTSRVRTFSSQIPPPWQLLPLPCRLSWLCRLCSGGPSSSSGLGQEAGSSLVATWGRTGDRLWCGREEAQELDGAAVERVPQEETKSEKTQGEVAGSMAGHGRMQAQISEMLQKRDLRSTGWDGEEAGGIEPTLAPVYVAPAPCWLQVSGEASLTRASPGHKLSTWMSSSRCQWT